MKNKKQKKTQNKKSEKEDDKRLINSLLEKEKMILFLENEQKVTTFH